MALKTKAPFGPGVSKTSKKTLRRQNINRRVRNMGMEFQRVKESSGRIIIPAKKKSTVKTPRRTSRGISF